MDHALLGADPAQLRVRDKMSPRLAPIRDEGREGPAFDPIRYVLNSSADDVITTTNGKCLL